MFFPNLIKNKKPNPQKENDQKPEETKKHPSLKQEIKSQKERTRSSAASTSPMVKIVEAMPVLHAEGDLIEGTVIEIDKSSVFVELEPAGTGIIYGREFINARDLIKKINIGDKITAKVVEEENEDGYVELSLKEARQALIWEEAEQAVKSKTLFTLPVKSANKGGVILEWQGVGGFLPASQLKEEHYPRVEDADKEKILEELQKLVGETMNVIILSTNPKEGKLIFSEKGQEQTEKEGLVEKYSIGDVVEGEITGIVDFGIFIKIEEGLEGLVHISEMDWGLVEDPRALFKVGEKMRVKIIEIKDGKISLSIKALKENPWIEAEKKYAVDDRVNAVIIKYNRHGALASIEEGVAGLVHVSEFGTNENLHETLELGKTYPFIITHLDPKTQKMALSYKTADTSEEVKKEATDGERNDKVESVNSS